MTPESLKSTASAAQRSSSFRILARAGYVVLGIVHIVIGAIAVSIAVGAGGGEADQSGAMQQIARVPFGVFVLWLIVLGMFALALWQIVGAFLEQDADAKKKWGHRAKDVGTAVAYIAIGATALVTALGGSSDSSQSTTSFSATLLSSPGGVLLLVLVALVTLGIGVAFVVRGIRKDFERQLSLPAGKVGEGVRVLGTVGYVAKGIAVAVVGVLFGVAAVTHDPEKASGLDGALKSLAALPFGQVILWLVGAGLVVYGIYCFARARYADV
ncbi:DUF1206 domain-containing protein [Agromyces sp. Leaf222]|uniref:DUF1206 domain-containing protein n=1 Tax=Agromyces sp. Leaf222 TaxID=1735688 RepID=UPI000700C3A2|nr:DUF1206 domain-containing protein [Agromyces sp. Leaf222]KQM83989.1 hypothetical protein ASE68_12905 [Agromyces sp. Leaf222]